MRLTGFRKIIIISLTVIFFFLAFMNVAEITQAGTPVLMKGFMIEDGPGWECHCPAENLYWDCFCKIMK